MSAVIHHSAVSNPHLASLQDLLAGTPKELEWLVIAHNDPVMIDQIARLVGDRAAAILPVPQGRWDMSNGMMTAAVNWSIEAVKTKHLLIVGHSGATICSSSATWIGDAVSEVADSQDLDASYSRLLAGARRVEAQIQRAKQHYAEQLATLCCDATLVESIESAKVNLHSLFYVAESNTFLMYDVIGNSFKPIQ